MSVNELIGREHAEVNPQCFYCSQPIEAGHPYIDCHPVQIFLHPACGIELCLRMMRDIHEIECRYHREVTVDEMKG